LEEIVSSSTTQNILPIQIKDWTTRPLSSVCSYINRGSPPSYTEEGGIIVLNQKCVRDHRVDFTPARRTSITAKPVSIDKIVQPFDILVNSTGVGTLGRIAQVKELTEETTIDSHITIVRPNSSEVDPLYLGIVLRGLQPEIEALGEGSTGQTELSRVRLGAFHVPMPSSIEEQRAIAHILGSLDEKIELNRKRNETLEAMARALFQDWFVDFGPVRAKMEGRDPYLPADIWDLFPERLDEDGKPVGWKHLPFGQLIEGSIGGDWGKDEPDGDEDQAVCIIRGTDIPELVAGNVGKVPTRFTTKKKLASRFLLDGDIVIEVSGGSPTQPTGRSLHVSNSMLERFKHPVVCASFCRRFRPVNKRLGILASCHLNNLYQIGGTWEYQNQSTGISNFQTTHFLDTEKVFVPQEDLISAFVDFIEPIRAVSDSNENIKLSNLRDALLPKLISGELSIKDLAIIQESSM
jgi:type I restriction enzyme S subunit